MGYWKGQRGSTLEEIINVTNEKYKEKGLAMIQKIPTPITPVEFSKESRRITLAYFERQSTVDYIGVVQGIAVCFDAKETKNHSLPLQNIHQHQVDFMEGFSKQGGLSFLLVHFTTLQKLYLLPIEELSAYWHNAQAGQRKSVPLSAFREEYLIPVSNICNYLIAVNQYCIAKSQCTLN